MISINRTLKPEGDDTTMINTPTITAATRQHSTADDASPPREISRKDRTISFGGQHIGFSFFLVYTSRCDFPVNLSLSLTP